MSALVRVRSAVSLMSAVAIAILAVVLFGPVSQSDAATFGSGTSASGSSTTVDAKWHRWNPIAVNNGDGTFSGASDTKTIPSVTVSQTRNLVDQVVRVTWKNFTPSSNDSTYSEDPSTGGPAPGVVFDNTPSNIDLYTVDVLECRGTSPTISYKIDPNRTQCYDAFIDDNGVGVSGRPNALHAVTQLDGTGFADLHIENRPTNNFLGCDAAHPCSIVVVPNNGGQQPVNPTPDLPVDCASHLSDINGPPSYPLDYYADRAYTAYGCSWADRIVIPIHFAPLPTNCPTGNISFNAIGSPMLERSLNQLLTGWCRGSDAANFNYNSTTPEPDARAQFLEAGQALTASSDVALVSRPADPGLAGQRKFAYAPIANNAISIPYYVDNVKTGRPMTDLRLDARLVAKLLTQSYQPYAFDCSSDHSLPPGTVKKPGPSCAPNVNGNPPTIFDDPEFQLLNMGNNHPDHPDRSDFPGSGALSNFDVIGDFFPSVAAGESDLTFELTRWVESDPDARGFLKGHSDPWGMHVNNAYKVAGGSLYPTDQFVALDPGWSAAPGADNRSLEGFQATWNPLFGLDNISKLLVGYQSTTANPAGVCSSGLPTDCDVNKSLAYKFATAAPEPVGSRNLWAVTDQPDAASYQFPTAQLMTSQELFDGTRLMPGNQSAEAPTATSMRAAIAGMHTNPDGVTQYVDHSDAPADGYPLTVPDYAMVPTCGLTAAKAAGIKSFLGHVLNSTTTGVQPGTLTPGLVTLDSHQRAQLAAARDAVSNQSCTRPAPDNVIEGQPHMRTGPTTRNGTNAQQPGGGGSGSSPNTDSSRHGTRAASPTPATPTPSRKPAVDLGYKPAGQHGSLGLALPIVLAIGAAFLVGAPLGWWFVATGPGQAAGAEIARRLRFRP